MNLSKVKKHQDEEYIDAVEGVILREAENSPERFSLAEMQKLLQLRKSLEIEHV
jgi:hypothetical protein